MVQLTPLQGVFDNLSQLRLTCQYCREHLGAMLASPGSWSGWRSPSPGWSCPCRANPTGRWRKRAGRLRWCAAGACPDRRCGVSKLASADEFVQGARAHAGSERRFVFHAVVHGVGEEVHVLHYNPRGVVLLIQWASYRLWACETDSAHAAESKVIKS